jgi:hypothetical protein
VDPQQPIEIAIKAISEKLKEGKGPSNYPELTQTQSEEEKVPEKPPAKFPGLNLLDKYGIQMNMESNRNLINTDMKHESFKMVGSLSDMIKTEGFSPKNYPKIGISQERVGSGYLQNYKPDEPKVSSGDL